MYGTAEAYDGQDRVPTPFIHRPAKSHDEDDSDTGVDGLGVYALNETDKEERLEGELS